MRILTTLAAITAAIAPAATVAKPMTPARAATIDAAVRSGMARTGTQGMAIAVIENGRVVMVRSYGIRDRSGAPLQPDTDMYAASLTKALFALHRRAPGAGGQDRLGRPRSQPCCLSRYRSMATSTDTGTGATWRGTSGGAS